MIPSILRFCNFFKKKFFARAGASRPLARSLPARKPALRAGFRAPTLIETSRHTTDVKKNIPPVYTHNEFWCSIISCSKFAHTSVLSYSVSSLETIHQGSQSTSTDDIFGTDESYSDLKNEYSRFKGGHHTEGR